MVAWSNKMTWVVSKKGREIKPSKKQYLPLNPIKTIKWQSELKYTVAPQTEDSTQPDPKAWGSSYYSNFILKMWMLD